MTTATRIDPRGSGLYLTFDSPSEFLATLGGRENPCTAIFRPRDYPTNAVDPGGLNPGAAIFEAATFGGFSSLAVGAAIRGAFGGEPFNKREMQIDFAAGALFSGGFSVARNLWAARAAAKAAQVSTAAANDVAIREIASKAGKTLGAAQTTGKVTSSACGGQSYSLLAASGEKEIAGLLPATGSNLLNAVRASGNNGLSDAERKGLEWLAAILGRGSLGEVTALTNRYTCPTCMQAARNFTYMFPGMSVTIGGVEGGVASTTVLNSVLINTGLGAIGPIALLAAPR